MPNLSTELNNNELKRSENGMEYGFGIGEPESIVRIPATGVLVIEIGEFGRNVRFWVSKSLWRAVLSTELNNNELERSENSVEG